MAAAKRFAKIRNRAQISPTVVEMAVFREGEEEIQEFTLVPVLSAQDLVVLTTAARDQDMEALPRMVGILARSMSDADGIVRDKWTPSPVGKGFTDQNGQILYIAPSILAELPESDQQELTDRATRDVYRQPDGSLAYSDDGSVDKWLDMSVWTSRRRWRHLMDDDDTAEVDIQDLLDLAEYTIGLATDRPTSPHA